MILVTGWNGNTGSIVVRALLEKGVKIVGLSRSIERKNSDFPTEQADLAHKDSVEAVFRKYAFQAVIHIANIRFSPTIMELAEQYKVPYVILVHTTGIYSRYRHYSSLYKEIEQSIITRAYNHTRYTILRPSMIYGNDRDYNMHKLIKTLSKVPIFPVFGRGSSRMQPIHVEDLGMAIVQCFERCETTANRAYDLSGGSVVTYKETIQLILSEVQRKVWLVHIPLGLTTKLVGLYEKLSSKIGKPIITKEQVERLQEDKVYSHDAAKADFNFHPRSFETGIRQEVELLKGKGLL